MKHLYNGIVECMVIRSYLMDIDSFLFKILTLPSKTKILVWTVLWNFVGKINGVYWKDSTPPFFDNAHTYSSKAYNQLARHNLCCLHSSQFRH